MSPAAPVTIELDERGVPLSHYPVPGTGTSQPRRSIVAIAEKGLDYAAKSAHHEFPSLTSYLWEPAKDARMAPATVGEPAPREGMLACAEWLANEAVPLDDAVVWRYDYPSYHGTSAGWRSGHAQGQAVRLLLHTWQETGQPEWRELAARAVRAFGIPVADGGFTLRLARRRWWYAKFADATSDEQFVLNGMLFALLGLRDAASHDLPNASLAHDYGSRAVRSMLRRYDAPGGSLYDLGGKRASLHYHRIHLQMIDALPSISSGFTARRILQRWRTVDTGAARGGEW